MASKAVREAKEKERQEKLAGTGVFLLRNISRSSTISLPKPSLDVPPKHMIAPGEVFRGDSYHRDALAQTGMIRLVDVERQEYQDPEEKPTSVNVIDPNTGQIRKMPIDKNGKIVSEDVVDADYEVKSLKGGEIDGVPD